mgnify:CR=1 FL=1
MRRLFLNVDTDPAAHIAVNIARMMNGDIKVESTLGEGSKFTVTVYLKFDNITQEDLDSYLMAFPIIFIKICCRRCSSPTTSSCSSFAIDERGGSCGHYTGCPQH